nr:MAG TPA: prohead serine protease [Caudoviricetes sp.]
MEPNNEIEIRSLIGDLHIESREPGTVSRTIVGYAAKFESWSDPIMGWFREKIARGAFDGCDLSDVIMCFNHNTDSILARTTSGTLRLEVDDVGLRFAFEAPNTTSGSDMLELVRRGDVSKCSFCFGVELDEWQYADEQNGLAMDERTILKFSRVVDVSLVVFPAYPETEASVRHLEERKAEYLRSLQDGALVEEISAEPTAPQSDNNDTMVRCLSRDRLVRVMRLKH